MDDQDTSRHVTGRVRWGKVYGFYSKFATKSLRMIVALAWNQAVSSTLESSGMSKSSGPWLHAFLVTTVLLLVIMVEPTGVIT